MPPARWPAPRFASGRARGERGSAALSAVWQRHHHPVQGQRGADLGRLRPVHGTVERLLGRSQPRRHDRGRGLHHRDRHERRRRRSLALRGRHLRRHSASALRRRRARGRHLRGWAHLPVDRAVQRWRLRGRRRERPDQRLDRPDLQHLRALPGARPRRGPSALRGQDPSRPGRRADQVSLGVRASKRGPLLAAADFPAEPLHIYNLNNSLADLGSLALGLASNGGPIAVAGPAGDPAGALSFVAASGQWLSASDAGLPAGLATRSYGGWFKCGATTADSVLLSWGTTGTGDTKLYVANADGTLHMSNAGSDIAGPFVRDGQWHHVALVEQNGGPPRRGLWLDGRLVAT